MRNHAKKALLSLFVVLLLGGGYLMWVSLQTVPEESERTQNNVVTTVDDVAPKKVLGAEEEETLKPTVVKEEIDEESSSSQVVKEEEPSEISLYPSHEATIHMVEDEEYSSKEYGFEEQRDLSSALPSYSTPANVNNDREVMGFLPYWKLSSYAELEYDKLSTIAYFALTTNGSGGWITTDSGYSGFYSTTFTNMLNKAHANGVKVVVVAKNFDATSIRKIVGNEGGAGDRLIANIINVIRVRGLDGVNVDFEYLGSVDSTLRANFVSWHDQLAQEVHQEFPGAHVSTDVFGSSPLGGTAYDLTALGRTDIDYIMMMTYDYITTSCTNGKRMTPMSPLYGNSNWSVSYHVGLATEQVPAGKIIMGVPYYGIDFRVQYADRSIYNAHVDYPNCQAVIETYGQIMNPIYDQWHNTASLRWHDGEKARWYIYNYNGDWRHGYYDDERSLGAKYDFVKSEGLGGIGIWALGYDSGRSELWTALRDNFQTGPFVVGFLDGTSATRRNAILDKLKLEVVEQINDNVWKVTPISGLSYDAIVDIRKYVEVTSADFENPRSTRTME